VKNILMLAAANVRKNKSQTATLLIFVLIAAMFLNIGLVLFLRVDSFFDERAEQNHTAHFTGIYQGAALSIEQGLRFMESYSGVAETEKINAIGGIGGWFSDGVRMASPFFLTRNDQTQKMNPLSLIGDYLPLTGDAIYIPYGMLLTSNYKIGDGFKLFLFGAELDFTVAGATEEIMFGSQTMTIYRFYIPDARFEELKEQFPDNGFTFLSARLENADNALFFQADYKKEVSSDGLLYDMSYDGVKSERTTIPTSIAIIITMFALILLIVSLIVIRFRIVNSIEEGMANIGSLKSIGYRNIQIVSGIILQFGITAFIGSAAGIALSQAVIPVIIGIFEPQLGLVWNQGFDVLLAAASLILVVAAMVFITFLTTRRIKNLHPLIALRGGLTTHSFKKNPLPLEKSRGGLDFLLAFKQLLRNKKQAVTIGVIVAAVSMMSIIGLTLNYSMNENRDSFAALVGGEAPDIQFILQQSGDSRAFRQRMSENPSVRKVFGYTMVETQILIDGEISINVTVAEDTSLIETQMMINGRYPRYNNEIALGVAASRLTGKQSGDTVTVKAGANQREYIITGIVQTVGGMITAEALRQIQPDYEFTEVSVYLREGVDVKKFIESVQAAEGNIFSDVIDMRELITATLDGMGGMFAAVAAGIGAVTVFVVILTLYMVIKTTVLRRKRELGIQKAIGFTTFQLMNQIALNMTPVILFGVITGAAAGYFLFNPMMGMMLGGMGIAKVDLPVPFGQMVVACAALVILAYGISMLIAGRIRKISAYSLVSE